VARFYANENIALQVVVELRRLGHDVLTSLDTGKANSAVPDAEVLASLAPKTGSSCPTIAAISSNSTGTGPKATLESSFARLTRTSEDRLSESTAPWQVCPTCGTN
jgi:hypothetical protein